jgi:DNA (cytosine-5)-methyltransferase 1
MKSKPKLLDVFCGAGGCSMGYHKAGFEVFGIDKEPQPNYPFQFKQMDFSELRPDHLQKFDFVHLSPPCQFASKAAAISRMSGNTYINLIPVSRKLLRLSNVPGIIENVPSKHIRGDIKLRGDLFGLHVIRLRFFECVNFYTLFPSLPPVPGRVENGDYVTVAGKGNRFHKGKIAFKYDKGSILDNWKFATDNYWMKTYQELANSIPWAYTEFIGKYILNNNILQKQNSIIRTHETINLQSNLCQKNTANQSAKMDKL